MDPDDELTDQEFWAMARRVRQVADEELAEIEYETDRAEQKRQDLTARAIQAMMEGERWQVAVGARVVDGVVVHAGQDYVGLQDRAGNLHDIIHNAVDVIRITEVDPTTGRAPTTYRPATFRARLLDLEQRREVELGGPGWSLVGLIDSVNSDHLIFVDRLQETAIVPIAAIHYLARTLPRARRG